MATNTITATQITLVLYLVSVLCYLGTLDKAGEMKSVALVPMRRIRRLYDSCWSLKHYRAFAWGVAAAVIGIFMEKVSLMLAYMGGSQKLVVTFVAISFFMVIPALLWCIVCYARFSFRLARSFGYKLWFGVFLFLLPLPAMAVISLDPYNYFLRPEDDRAL